MIDCKEQEERFLNDIENHKMTIIRDDGTDRHIQFRKPGTICYGFDLLTWPGHLCVTGDCGTFVFRRIEDMFEFFRLPEKYYKQYPEQKLNINLGYWHEKVLAQERHGGCEKYSEDVFKKEIKEWFDDWAEGRNKGLVAEAWEEVENGVLSYGENEYSAIDAAMCFRYDDLDFTDFWEINLKEYTFDYIWCCFAIVWGIQKYDEFQIAKKVA